MQQFGLQKDESKHRENTILTTFWKDIVLLLTLKMFLKLVLVSSRFIQPSLQHMNVLIDFKLQNNNTQRNTKQH